jgi:hypothetical protein
VVENKDWSHLKKDKTPEDAAFEEAERATHHTVEEKKSIVRGGRKRLNEYGSSNLPLLPGCSKEDSDKIRELLGYKYLGYTQSDAFERVGIKPGSGAGWIVSRQEAYEMAEAELRERVIRSYNTNLWILRSGLSEAGPRAVRTLVEIMDNKKAPVGTRAKAAVSILKMLDVDQSATGNNMEKLSSEVAKAIKDGREEVKSDRIIDADDAEVVEDVQLGD